MISLYIVSLHFITWGGVMNKPYAYYEHKKLNNFKIGINGVITFKNSRLSEIIRQTDIRKIVLETDAPYLAPVPYRGKRNEPAYIWKTAEKVAQTYGLTLEDTVETTRINALKLFKIENKPIS